MSAATVCAACHRVLLAEHADALGRCCFCGGEDKGHAAVQVVPAAGGAEARDGDGEVHLLRPARGVAKRVDRA